MEENNKKYKCNKAQEFLLETLNKLNKEKAQGN